MQDIPRRTSKDSVGFFELIMRPVDSCAFRQILRRFITLERSLIRSLYFFVLGQWVRGFESIWKCEFLDQWDDWLLHTSVCDLMVAFLHFSVEEIIWLLLRRKTSNWRVALNFQPVIAKKNEFSLMQKVIGIREYSHLFKTCNQEELS